MSRLVWPHVKSGIAQTILQGIVRGTSRGRQKKRWEDIVKELTSMGIGNPLREAEVMYLILLIIIKKKYFFKESKISVKNSPGGALKFRHFILFYLFIYLFIYF